MVEYAVAEPARPSQGVTGAKAKWYPLANIVTPHMKTRGTYPDGYPRGAVVHFTAGRDQTEKQARNSVSNGRENGYCYFVIGPAGEVYQAFPLDRWGYHAGESSWKGLGASVSSKLVGIELCAAGRLSDENESWFGVRYDDADVREVNEDHYGCPSGRYKKYTERQEAALFQLLTWLKNNNPSVFSYDLVLGHHEVSGMKGIGRWRKNDPGGALSMTMNDLRDRLEAAG